MASVNKVIIIGNLGRDPEVRYAASGAAICNVAIATSRSWKDKTSGAAICNVAIATSRSWKDKTSGERQEETEWHRVVFYDRLAEIAGEYLKKGKSVYVEGRLKTRKWTDKDGVEKYTTEIIAQEMTMLGGREDGAGPRGGGGDEGGYSEQQPRSEAPRRAAPPPRAPAPAPRAPAAKSSTGFDDMDDDIPF